LTDEIKQKGDSPELPPGEQNPPEAEELEQNMASEAEVDEPESLVAQKNEELAKANARLIELEKRSIEEFQFW